MNKLTSIFFSRLLVAVLAIGFFASCSDDNEDDMMPVRMTYNFENVSYSGQTTRLETLGKLTKLMDAFKLNGEGEGMPAREITSAELINLYKTPVSGKWIKNKVHGFDPESQENDLFEAMMVKLAKASESFEQEAQRGQAGVAGGYLFDENGVEYKQLIEKGLMGALMYYQATSVYMGDEKMNVDNEEIAEGKGTDMQHHWDEAYGYFPAMEENNVHVLDQSRYWGKYSGVTSTEEVNLDSRAKIYQLFIDGREAIGQKDYAKRDAVIAELRNEWELVVAGTAIHYLNEAHANADVPKRLHQLSEALAFIRALQYNPTTKTDAAAVTALENELGANFYDVLDDAIVSVRDNIAARYPKLEAHKGDL